MTGSILVVDADVGFCTAVSELLTPRGHRVTVTHRGTQALEEQLRAPSDVVVADVRLPDMEGLALLTKLRERDEQQELIRRGA